MSSQELPPAYVRFFARIRAFDISCPKCGCVASVGAGKATKHWNPINLKWECSKCHAIYFLGVIAWQARFASGPYSTPPDDQRMKVHEALALRRGLSIWAQTRLMNARQERNVVIAGLPTDFPEARELCEETLDAPAPSAVDSATITKR